MPSMHPSLVSSLFIGFTECASVGMVPCFAWNDDWQGGDDRYFGQNGEVFCVLFRVFSSKSDLALLLWLLLVGLYG